MDCPKVGGACSFNLVVLVQRDLPGHEGVYCASLRTDGIRVLGTGDGQRMAMASQPALRKSA